jgi:hypothetical protein
MWLILPAAKTWNESFYEGIVVYKIKRYFNSHVELFYDLTYFFEVLSKYVCLLFDMFGY